MKQTEYIGAGELSKLSGIVQDFAPSKVFLITGKSSYIASGATQLVELALAGIDVLHYTDISALPLDEDIKKGVIAYTSFNPDLVIAVGGGHVIDMTKSINFLAGKKPLVAIPTTAGTGSEATSFSVVYKNGRKTSLESPDMLPMFAIVDPNLAMSVSRETALPSALDALCQAIESFWSNKATEESRGYARQALQLIWKNIIPAIEKRDSGAITALCIGAHLAGKAINISKTTACHAFSYGLTYRFGVPHGIAVALFLPSVYRYNNVSGLSMSPEDIEGLLRRFGITNLSQYGVKPSDIAMLAAEVNTERLGNNPRVIREGDIINFFQKIV
ncbi:phosphonoacetaldehyde reductase [Candidatus Kaiserbacteria bacterium]|nr:phosphonoacetaldehyde reductase [Candidatus Kaiserbacteria bacterium]